MQPVINIFEYIIVVITQVILIISFGKLSNRKIEFNKMLVFIILCSSLIEEILSYTIDGTLKGIICIIYFIILSKIFAKTSIKESIFYLLFVLLIGIMLDIFFMLIVNLFLIKLPFCKDNLENIKIVCTIMMAILIILLTGIKGIQNFAKKVYLFLQKFRNAYILLIFIFIMFIGLEAITISNINEKVIVKIVFVITLALIVICYAFILYKYEILTLKETKEYLIKNSEYILKLLDEYRIFKHNLTSQLLGIKTVANKKTKQLIDDLIIEYSKKPIIFNDMKNYPSGLSGLIYEKTYQYNELKISVENKLKHNLINSLTPRNYNLLCESLGIVLDNAVFAANKSEKKIILIKFNEVNDNIKVTITNSFEGKIDIDKIGKKNYSTKGKGHGLGLFSLISREKVEINTKIKNDLFITTLIIQKNKK